MRHSPRVERGSAPSFEEQASDPRALYASRGAELRRRPKIVVGIEAITRDVTSFARFPYVIASVVRNANFLVPHVDRRTIFYGFYRARTFVLSDDERRNFDEPSMEATRRFDFDITTIESWTCEQAREFREYLPERRRSSRRCSAPISCISRDTLRYTLFNKIAAHRNHAGRSSREIIRECDMRRRVIAI